MIKLLSNVELEKRIIDNIELYVDEVLRIGKSMNLTADLDREVFIKKHIVDCLSIMNFVDFSVIDRAVDIGTGAGLPGFVLALANESTTFTLVDSLNKRMRFLSETLEKIGTENIHLECMRAEDFTRHDDYRESFDAVFSRAVASLSVLLEYSAPALKVGGHFYAYKSQRYEDELMEAKNALEILSMSLNDTYEYKLADGEYRIILDFVKMGYTDDKYPRRNGKPLKRPL